MPGFIKTVLKNWNRALVDDIKIKWKVSPFFLPLPFCLPFIVLLSLFFCPFYMAWRRPKSLVKSRWNYRRPKLTTRRIDQLLMIFCTRIEWDVDRWEFERSTRHCMEFKITKDKIVRWNKMLLFLNNIKKIYLPFLVSVVHLAYLVVLGVFSGLCRSFL